MSARAVPRLRTICVAGLRLDASLGVHAHEKDRRQPVEIDLEVDVLDEDPGDDTSRILDYEILVNRIRALLDGEHVALAESLADHVARIALDHPTARRARVRLMKLTAIDDCRGVGVALERRREDDAP